MPRRCFALDLDPASAADYAARHAPGAVWPEVVAHLREQGVDAMEIWHVGDRLLMIAEVSPDYPRPVPVPARVVEWEVAMDRYQRRLPFAAAAEKWVPMTRIFALDGDGSGGVKA